MTADAVPAPELSVDVAERQQWRSFATCAAVAVVIALPHIIASPGYTTVPWGDYGRWLHEAERWAQGEVLYRDFTWPFPPFAMWIVGGWMKLAGTSLSSVFVLMTAVTVAILVLHAHLVSRTVPERLAPWVTAASVLPALALAQRESASLPLGMYTPAAPIGVLLMLAALALLLVPVGRRETWRAILLGFLCGAMVLTKQDFWLPAILFMVLSRSVPALVAALLTAGAGALVVAMSAGVDVLPKVLTGFNHIREFGMYGMPDWEGLTIALIATLICGSGIVLMIAAPRRYAATFAASAAALMALHIAMSWRHGIVAAPVDSAVHLARRLSTHFPPVLLPVALFAVVAVRRRRLENPTWLLAALGLCLAARARRGFHYTEWYHVLLEVPVYVIVCLALQPGARTASRVRFGLVAVLAFGLAAEWSLGRIPRPGAERLPATVTPRGVVHWYPDEAARMAWLDEQLDARDPGGTRPLIAFGYSGGYSYFLKRPAASGMTQGFRLSRFAPDSVVKALRRRAPPIFALDSREYDSLLVRAPGFPLGSWLWPTRVNHYVRFDRPWFLRLIEGCRAVSTFPARAPVLTLYDCG
jgi:hypothetical protein